MHVKNPAKTKTNCLFVREYNFIFIDLRENIFHLSLKRQNLYLRAMLICATVCGEIKMIVSIAYI